MAQADGHTRIVVQFSRLYQPAGFVLGHAEQTADRCFTMDLDTQTQRAQVTAHNADTSCADVAPRVR